MNQNTMKNGLYMWALASMVLLLAQACGGPESMPTEQDPTNGWIPDKADTVAFDPDDLAGRVQVRPAIGHDGYELLDDEAEGDFKIYDQANKRVWTGEFKEYLTLTAGTYVLVVNDTFQEFPIKPEQDTIIHLGRIDLHDEQGNAFAIAVPWGRFSEKHPDAKAGSERIMLSHAQSVHVVAGTYELTPPQSMGDAKPIPISVVAGQPTLVDYQGRHSSLMVHWTNEYSWLHHAVDSVASYGPAANLEPSSQKFYLFKDDDQTIYSLMNRPLVVDTDATYKVVVNDTWMDITPKPNVSSQIFVGEIVVYNSKNEGSFQVTPANGCYTEGHETVLGTRFPFGRVLQVLPDSYSIDFFDAQGNPMSTEETQLDNVNNSTPVGSCSICHQNLDNDYSYCGPC